MPGYLARNARYSGVPGASDASTGWLARNCLYAVANGIVRQS
jgi:hypothetical protein